MTSTTTTDRLSWRAAKLASLFPDHIVPDLLLRIAEDMDQHGYDPDDWDWTSDASKRLDVPEDEYTPALKFLGRVGVTDGRMRAMHPASELRDYCHLTGAELVELGADEVAIPAAEIVVAVEHSTTAISRVEASSFDAEPPAEVPKVVVPAAPVEAITEPIASPPLSGWQWDGTRGYNSAREWSLSLMMCPHLTDAPKRVGALYRERGHTGRGEGWVSNADAEKFLGIGERAFKRNKQAIRDAGWLTDTGRVTKHEVAIYAFTAPVCGCSIIDLGPEEDD